MKICFSIAKGWIYKLLLLRENMFDGRDTAVAIWIYFKPRKDIWATTWDFQQYGMCDQQMLRSACAYVQSDQSLCMSLEYSMTDWTTFWVSKLKWRLHRLRRPFMSKCHIQISCRGSFVGFWELIWTLSLLVATFLISAYLWTPPDQDRFAKVSADDKLAWKELIQ